MMSTKSQSITQETKARFNELLNSAICRETSDKSEEGSFILQDHSKKIPTALPRKKKPSGKNEENIELSQKGWITKRKVIAEVHTSRSRLIASSSDDDILSEKKEKKKRKRLKSKQAITEKNEQITNKAHDNTSSGLEPYSDKNSPSRLSNRSYIVETPTFAVEEIKLLTETCHENAGFENDSNDVTPISKNPDKFLPSENKKLIPISLTSKIPVPLPRRKSLKSLQDSDENGIERVSSKSNDSVNLINDDSKSINNKDDDVVTINETLSNHYQEDAVFKSAVVKLQGSVDHTEDDSEISLAVKKHKVKKKRRKVSNTRNQLELQELSSKRTSEADDVEGTMLHYSGINSTQSQTPENISQSNDDQVISVTIHGMDSSLVDSLVRHPVVRLFIVDTSTGEYLAKSDPTRSVCYFNEGTSYIPPIMTQPFDFKQHRSMQPCWEECLLINENLSHLLNPHTLLLFELSDFLPASLAGSNVRLTKLGSKACWHVVAWAFLRPTSHNLATRLKLQLYKPSKQPKKLRTLTPAVYEWWGTAVRHKYKGCLQVTVSSVKPPPTPLSPHLRSRTALQSEQGSVPASGAASEVNSDINCREEEKAPAVEIVWSRLPAQSCKVPNSSLHRLPVDGCMCLEFSRCGRWLACARKDIMVYSVPTFIHTSTLSGHQGLVYSLQWSEDSKVLLSASADCTICVWRPKHLKSPLLQMLGHPSFVYCARFLPTQGNFSLISGCYDGQLRLWRGDSHSSYRLVQELCGTSHEVYITAVCVSVDGKRVVVAENRGGLKVYELDNNGRLTGGRELRVRELRGKIISNVVPHPGGHRLLIHTRDSLVRSVDIATGAIIQTFKGCKNERLQTGMCVSSCGSLVFACGEDGNINVWDGHTGFHKAVYSNLLPQGSAAIHYHPHDHILAVASLSQPPLHILTFNRDSSGNDIGLNLVSSNEKTGTTMIKTIMETSKWRNSVSKVSTNIFQNTIKNGDITKDKVKCQILENRDETIQNPATNSKWSLLPQIGHAVDITWDDKDLRLLEIIKKMDSIILAAKQSSHP